MDYTLTIEHRDTFVATELNSSPEKSTRKGPKSFVISAVQLWGRLRRDNKQLIKTMQLSLSPGIPFFHKWTFFICGDTVNHMDQLSWPMQCACDTD